MDHSLEQVEFGLYDPQAEVGHSRRCLPHWFQPGVATFVTFRTIDSLPADVIIRWREEQRTWLQQNGIELRVDDELPEIGSLPIHLQKEFRRHRDRQWNWHLDNCHGDCVLRRPELARIVGDSLLHFDGERYDLDCFVVMPNHVHLLVQFRPPVTLHAQSESWLRFTARQINQKLGRSKAFWQSEPFDHLVRSVEQFEYLQRYITENPQKAHLKAGDFLYWKR